jgi:hypothetical protein
MIADQLHGSICIGLADVADSGGTEKDSSAFVTGPSEGLLGNHDCHSADTLLSRSSRPGKRLISTDLRQGHWLDLQDFVADFAAGGRAGRSAHADYRCQSQT